MDAEFSKYINKLQDPAFVLRGCLTFFTKYEGYLDELAESIWQNFLKGGKRPPVRLILGAAEAILIKWNCPFLFESEPDKLIHLLKDNRISKVLVETYEATEHLLTDLYNLELGSPNFIQYADLIKQVYSRYEACEVIRMTGASKALHFIHPKLFVPWDTIIREYYHKYDPNHTKNHKIGSPECYIDFLSTNNNITMQLIKRMPKDQLTKEHPAYSKLQVIRTIPKMLDECNYCWLRKGERW